MSGNLTDEQRRKIDENRRKALEKRAARLNHSKQPNNSTLTLSKNLVNTDSVGSSSSHSIARQSNSTKHTVPASKDASFDVGRSFPGQASKSSFNESTFTTTTTTQSGNETSTTQTTSIQDFVSKFARPGSSKSSFSKGDKGKLDNRPEQTQGNDKVCGAPNFGASKDVKVVKGTCILISKNRFAVKAAYHAQLIGMFKTIPSRSYDQTTTTWSFALEDYKSFMTAAKPLQPNVYIEGLPKTVLSVFTKTTPGTLKELSTQDINLNSVDSKLVSSLMPFQKQGVSFCIRHDGRALIADDMGLGKTIQAICVAGYYRKEWPLLVITPSSVRITWQQAILRWLPSVDPQRINVVFTGKDKPTSGLVNIISYDLLSKFTEQLKANPPRVIIADESHFIKNYKAARTKVASPLIKSATRVLLLSGTPALSRPVELYTQISAVKPRLFPSFHEFGLRYCAAMQNRWGWDYSGSSNMEELQLILEESIMIRRMKTEVLTELPSKRRQMVLLDPSLIKTKPLDRAAKQVAHAKEKDQHGALLNYFYETCSSKMPAVREYVLDLLEGGHKLLVFAHHKDMLDAITTCLTAKKYKFIRIDGDTPSSKRQLLCDKFQKEKEVLVAVLSITAANTGLTLTAGSTVVFAELFWNPGALVQAEDRVYRIGQKNSVNIHYLVAKATADDFLWPLIQGKLEVLNKAGLSGDDFSNADMITFKDPKQKTLFSCFESLIEENGEIDSALCDALDQETTRATLPMATDAMTTDSMATTSTKDDKSKKTADCGLDQETTRATLPMATDAMTTDSMATTSTKDDKSKKTADCGRHGQQISSNEAKSILSKESSKVKTIKNTEDQDEEDLGFSWFTSFDDDESFLETELLCEQTSEATASSVTGKSKKSTFEDDVEPSPKRSKR